MNNKCERCGCWFESPRERRWCSGACRVAAHRDVKAKRESAALDLLARQSAAIAAGANPVILAALAREAKGPLGARVNAAPKAGDRPIARELPNVSADKVLTEGTEGVKNRSR